MPSISDVISNMQQPGGEPSEHPRDLIFEAVLKGRHGITYNPGMRLEALLSKTTMGQLRREVKWWEGRYADPDDEERVDPPDNATPENIIAFFAWWRMAYPDASAPEKRESIIRHWANWELSKMRGRRNPSMAAPTLDPELAPKHYEEGPRAATMTQADIDAYYAQIAESKTEAREALRKVKGDYRRAK